MDQMRFDIGGVFNLTLVQGEQGFTGEYTMKGSSAAYSFDGAGMSKKEILTIFWNKARIINKRNEREIS